MRILIMTVLPERQEYYEYLKEKLPNAEFVLDEKKQAFHTLLKALEQIGNDGVLLMEDDALLTVDFENKVKAVIKERPHEVINFFSRRKKDIEVGSRYESGASFNYNICFYMPPMFAKSLLKYAKKWYKENKEEHPTGTDTVIAEFLSEHGMNYYNHVPSLVQHRIGKSRINSRRARDRTSKTFVDLWE